MKVSADGVYITSASQASMGDSAISFYDQDGVYVNISFKAVLEINKNLNERFENQEKIRSVLGGR